jgi:hypothetical protein
MAEALVAPTVEQMAEKMVGSLVAPLVANSVERLVGKLADHLAATTAVCLAEMLVAATAEQRAGHWAAA